MVVGEHILFVDTSGWIEVFGKNNPQHNDAIIYLDYAIQHHHVIVTTNYVIAEFVGRGENSCKMSRQALLDAVGSILILPNIEYVHVGEESHKAALTLLRNRLDKQWSLVDATSINILWVRDIENVLSTDHHFDEAGIKKLLKSSDETFKRR